VTTTATVNSSPITATVSGSTVTATVGSSPVSASVSGGVGPQGATGPSGLAGDGSLSALIDVEITQASTGDVLRYANGKWRDYPDVDIVDGGNW
jgi:hypothetical protein